MLGQWWCALQCKCIASNTPDLHVDCFFGDAPYAWSAGDSPRLTTQSPQPPSCMLTRVSIVRDGAFLAEIGNRIKRRSHCTVSVISDFLHWISFTAVPGVSQLWDEQPPPPGCATCWPRGHIHTTFIHHSSPAYVPTHLKLLLPPHWWQHPAKPHLLGNRLVKTTTFVLRPVPTAVPPCARRYNAGSGLHTGESVLHLSQDMLHAVIDISAHWDHPGSYCDVLVVRK